MLPALRAPLSGALAIVLSGPGLTQPPEPIALGSAPGPQVVQVRDLASGAVFAPAAGGWRAPRGVVAYDNFYNNLPGSTPGRLNLAALDPNTLAPLCIDAAPLGAPYLRAPLPTGVEACEGPDPNETGLAADVIGSVCPNQRPADAYLDDYLLDPNVTGDPNASSLICHQRLLWTHAPDAPPAGADRQVLNVVFVDLFDHAGAGGPTVTGGYSITVEWGGTPSRIGVFDIDLSMLPGGGAVARNSGAFILDVANNAVDAAGNPIAGDLACGTAFEQAGGWRCGGAPCAPADLYTVSRPALADFRRQFNLFNALPDPNTGLCPGIDPGSDGDPGSLSYQDALNQAVFFNPVADCDGPAQVRRGENLVTTLTVDDGPCETACTGVDDDGDIDLDDLLILLDSFLRDADGDFDCDGDTDLDDLLILLAVFGQPCP